MENNQCCQIGQGKPIEFKFPKDYKLIDLPTTLDDDYSVTESNPNNKNIYCQVKSINHVSSKSGPLIPQKDFSPILSVVKHKNKSYNTKNKHKGNISTKEEPITDLSDSFYDDIFDILKSYDSSKAYKLYKKLNVFRHSKKRERGLKQIDSNIFKSSKPPPKYLNDGSSDDEIKQHLNDRVRVIEEIQQRQNQELYDEKLFDDLKQCIDEPTELSDNLQSKFGAAESDNFIKQRNTKTSTIHDDEKEYQALYKIYQKGLINGFKWDA
ncbi:hypothetical protein WICMUC_000384 [Wickerhamomyces mucosus]|uniref:Uncharacterized protein n=1 Tax=Wickerhamomyces mucosus TaxID=1378264 RepID=A0A9P8PY37_9ASCO|nr:hypothetical protein WICMUC_000384 [Wickerhamomyces mucosus]